MQHQIRHHVYLDHAAATPVDPAVAAVLCEHTVRTYGNASAMYGLGREAHTVLTEARRSVAESLAVNPDEIVFTGSGTESDNLAILGAARSQRARGQHIVISSIEHKAVLAAAAVLEREGFEVTRVPVSIAGLVSVEAVRASLRSDTTLVSIMYANNEIGTIQPIADIAALLETLPADERPLLHSDACQAVGGIPVHPADLGVDLLTLNGSKIYGPKGIGALFVRRGVVLAPQIVGGDQEGQRRAGTENVGLAAAFATALSLATAKQPSEAARLYELREHFRTQVLALQPEILINGDLAARLPNNLHITVPELEGESLVLELDQYGICCATGSACSAHDLNPSHVLRAIGMPDELIHGSLRFSLGRSTTKDDIDYTVACLEKCLERLYTITATKTLRTQPLHV